MTSFRRPILRKTAFAAAAFAWIAPIQSRGAVPGTSATTEEIAKRIERSIVRFDFDEAHRELGIVQAVTNDPRVALERARLALYELDCDGAAAILDRPEVQRIEDGETLADTARGCARVTASLATSKDEARAIEVRWQDENDAPLAPLLFDTVAKAREALSRDLGVDWPQPTRIVVVRDLLSLSAMTGLPYDSARTTGTVAVAKWGRVTLLSPRASRHGFPWQDTVAHELTHLAVTRATDDRAPLWLQEGIAKRQEVRWREPRPFDDRPPADTVARIGIERGLAIPLDKLGPSIAMLPTADAARVAFAEVTSFVGFYMARQGAGALPELFRQIRDGKNPNDSMVAASGADFKTWDGRWRASLSSPPARSQTAWPSLSWIGGDDPKDHGGRTSALRELRDRARLAELLLGRGHAAEALDELAHLDAPNGAGPRDVAIGNGDPAGRPSGREPPGAPGGPADASIVWLHGRALEMLGRTSELAPLVSDTGCVVSSYGPWWALRGRWARSVSDARVANDSFVEAVSADPLDSEVACGAASAPAPLPIASAPSLCDAAKERGEPPFDGD